MKNHMLPRRDFIKIGSGIILYPIFTTPFACTTSIPEKSNWHSKGYTPDHNGQLQIIDMDGLARIDGKSLKAGMSISRGELLTVDSGSLHASLPNGSMIKLSQKAIISVDLDSQEGGFIHVKKGAVLSVIRPHKKRPIMIKIASAVVGVRGTVCFTQVLSDEDKQNPIIPQKASDYFCLCNGAIDYLNSSLDSIQLDKSDYHSAKFLIPEHNRLVFKDAGFLLNHSDSEITSLIDLMPGTKDSNDWLFQKKNNSYYKFPPRTYRTK